MKNNFLRLLLGLVLFLFVSCASVNTVSSQVSSQTTQNNWNPKKTWVFFVGLLEWQDSKTFASFPQENRRDIVLLDVLRERGVPENQILFLKDREATTEKIQSSFVTFLSKAQPDDWVFVYYCGHGYKDDDYKETFLASYDATLESGWNVVSIPDTINKFFKGSNALIMLDNCFSGAMANAVNARHSRVSYSVLASSHHNSFSTGNWTFTESLIYAFRGESFIDENSDGKINLGELKQNSAEDMLFAEEQITQFTETGNLNNQTIIAENVSKPGLRVGERIEAFDRGSWYRGIITESDNNKFKVHFFGYEYDEDLWRTSNQIRKFTPKTYPVGSRIEAKYEEEWFPARILEVKGGAHLVRYEDYGAEFDEWLSSDRIRRRRK